MTVTEKFIKGKMNNEALCEDMILVNENFVAVIDGVTSKSEKLINGKSGGIACAEAIFDAIKKAPEDIDAKTFTKLLTDAVSSLYDITEEKGYAAASVIAYSNTRKEIWSIGDCQCIINGEKHLHEKAIDKELSEIRAKHLEEEIAKGVNEKDLLSHDTGREIILSRLKEQHKFANKICEYGYPVINGTSVPEEMIVVYKIKNGDEIVLASDGYPVLCDTLEESEKLLSEELKNNPLCYKNYKSTKGIKAGNCSFDDRAYVKIKIG